jgi:hypothetical protein
VYYHLLLQTHFFSSKMAGEMAPKFLVASGIPIKLLGFSTLWSYGFLDAVMI